MDAKRYAAELASLIARLMRGAGYKRSYTNLMDKEIESFYTELKLKGVEEEAIISELEKKYSPFLMLAEKSSTHKYLKNLSLTADIFKIALVIIVIAAIVATIGTLISL